MISKPLLWASNKIRIFWHWTKNFRFSTLRKNTGSLDIYTLRHIKKNTVGTSKNFLGNFSTVSLLEVRGDVEDLLKQTFWTKTILLSFSCWPHFRSFSPNIESISTKVKSLWKINNKRRPHSGSSKSICIGMGGRFTAVLYKSFLTLFQILIFGLKSSSIQMCPNFNFLVTLEFYAKLNNSF